MKRKWQLILGAIVILLAIIWIGLEKNQGLTANVLEVNLGSIAKTFKEEGRVVPQVEQTIFAIYGGKIAQLLVEEGSQVQQGQLLVEFDTQELDFQIKQLEAQLLSIQGEKIQTNQAPLQSQLRSQELLVQQAERSLEVAEKDFIRLEQLYDAGAITKKALEEGTLFLEKARTNLELQREALSLLHESRRPPSGTAEFYAGRIEAVQAQLELLQYQKSRQVIESNMTGRVKNLAVKHGDLVAPHQPIMGIFQEDGYQVEVYVLAGEVENIYPEMAVKLIRDRREGDVIFPGSVRKIAPAAVETVSVLGLAEQRVKITVIPQVPLDLRLFPGFNLDVEFTIDKREDVLVVPKSALFPYQAGEALWVVREGRAQLQPVVTGFEHSRAVVIQEGLTEGDLVILNPQLKGLKEGQRIAAVKR